MLEIPSPTDPSAPSQRGKTLIVRHKQSFLREHSLSIASVAIVLLWIVSYSFSDPSKHWGSFFGNAIADWTGVVVTVLATKWLYEKGLPRAGASQRQGSSASFASCGITH